MGNAAGVSRRAMLQLEYEPLAEIIRNSGGDIPIGTHVDDLRILIAQAIREEKLDILELLIPLLSKLNSSKEVIFPVHITALEGKLECLDIFLSAGLCFNRLSGLPVLNDNGETPLHLGAMNRSLESALCTTLLVQRGGNAILRIKNNTGDSCMHIAAENNNVRFIQALQSSCTSSEFQKLLAVKNSLGQTPIQIAKCRGGVDALELFEQIRAKQTAIYQREIDNGRIMQVWERFFENAARKLMGLDLLMGQDFKDDEEKMNESKFESAQKISRLDKEEHGLHDWELVKDWWSHVVVYEKSSCYVIHQHTGNSMWLSHFVKSRCSLLYSAKEFTNKPPHNIIQATKLGWITYFDHVTNRSLFLNVRSWECEQFLPIGVSPRCVELGFSFRKSADGDEWVEPNPICSHSWVQVIVKSACIAESETHTSWDNWPAEVTSTAPYYFWNRVTGQKVFLEPPGCFDDFSEWSLCGEEGDLANLFWHNPSTEESVWCEAGLP